MSEPLKGPPDSRGAAPEGTATRHSCPADIEDHNRSIRRCSVSDECVCERSCAHGWAADQSIPAQLRRRREAAYRLPPLPHSNRRDPWSGRVG